ncbi:hypothetical protein ACJX0J_016732, partial [Zea mays]
QKVEEEKFSGFGAKALWDISHSPLLVVRILLHSTLKTLYFLSDIIIMLHAIKPNGIKQETIGSLHHLNPNGVQHMAAFTTLCEGYLG